MLFIDALVEGLAKSVDGLVEFLAADEMVLALDHGEGGHDAFLKDEQFGFEIAFEGV